MARLHGRSPRDWTIDFDLDMVNVTALGSLNTVLVPGQSRYVLSMLLTYEEVRRLMNEIVNPGDPARAYPARAYRGTPHLDSVSFGTAYRVSGIEITREEVERIRKGTDPLDVLLPAWPECGYRLTAVPVKLPAG